EEAAPEHAVVGIKDDVAFARRVDFRPAVRPAVRAWRRGPEGGTGRVPGPALSGRNPMAADGDEVNQQRGATPWHYDLRPAAHGGPGLPCAQPRHFLSAFRPPALDELLQCPVAGGGPAR